jgi:hypothetical protein
MIWIHVTVKASVLFEKINENGIVGDKVQRQSLLM